MKVPIKHAIESGAWFHCTSFVGLEMYEFRLKILSFTKIALDEIDETFKIDANRFDLEEGDFGLLKFQMVNLAKAQIGTEIIATLQILDHDEFQYAPILEDHLCVYSKFAQTSGLSKMVLSSDLFPKIKCAYSCAYFLPKEDNAEYYLAVACGDIQEV